MILRDRLEELTEDGNAAEEWDLLEGLGFVVVEQTADGEALSLAQLDLCLYFAHSDRWDCEAGNGDGVGEVQRADLGATWSRMVPRGVMVGMKFRRTPYSLNSMVTAPRDASGGSLHHGVGIFSAGEKACLFAVLGNDVRFGEGLDDPLASGPRLWRPDSGPGGRRTDSGHS